METKREVSTLLPYYIKDGQVFVYLQKRYSGARILPGHFSFFGGKLEPGENITQALEREIKEELGIALKEYTFLGTYQSGVTKEVILHVHFLKVDDNFEKEVTVMEGEYGKFFSPKEVADEVLLIDSDKNIIKDLYQLVNNKKRYTNI